MYRVMIIEDDPMVASINRQYIEMNKELRVVAKFNNGQDGLDYLKKNKIDLIILDVYMPVMDGLTFLQNLRKSQESPDVIMVTAANDAEHVRKLLSLGVIDYLVKPFEYARFNKALSRFMQHQATFNQENVSQTDLDNLLNHQPAAQVQSSVLSKGLQEKTLKTILDYMELHGEDYLTSEKVAEEVHLSRVTIRRYMNYLLETQAIVSDIDYTTGGRPSIRYRYCRH